VTTQRNRTEWRVVYRRVGWLQPQARIVGTRDAADRLVAKITAPGRPDLAPVAYLAVSSRPVGAWETVEQIIGDRAGWR